MHLFSGQEKLPVSFPFHDLRYVQSPFACLPASHEVPPVLRRQNCQCFFVGCMSLSEVSLWFQVISLNLFWSPIFLRHWVENQALPCVTYYTCATVVNWSTLVLMSELIQRTIWAEKWILFRTTRTSFPQEGTGKLHYQLELSKQTIALILVFQMAKDNNLYKFCINLSRAWNGFEVVCDIF